VFLKLRKVFRFCVPLWYRWLWSQCLHLVFVNFWFGGALFRQQFGVLYPAMVYGRARLFLVCVCLIWVGGS